MSSNLDRFKTDLAKLVDLGDEMILELDLQRRRRDGTLTEQEEQAAAKLDNHFQQNYQRWYTEVCVVIKQLVPDRLPEITNLYHGDGKRKQVNIYTYNIQDWLNGLRAGDGVYGKNFDDLGVILMRYQNQLAIVKSVQSRFESSLYDIAQLARADLFDSELDAARELSNKGFLRGAGAISGVVLEKHLQQVCKCHNLTIRKSHPTISAYNDALKDANVIDIAPWRQIQRLGDLRNLCDHKKQREPVKEEIDELIEGTDKLSKTLF